MRGAYRADDFVDPDRRGRLRFLDGAEESRRHVGVSRIEAIDEGLVEGWRRNAQDGVAHVLGRFDEGGALFE